MRVFAKYQTRMVALGAACLWGTMAGAQHGTAPQGFYPGNYHGDTFTGRVIHTSDDTGEIALEYKSKKKTETFAGSIEGPCMAHTTDSPRGEAKQMHLSAIPSDSVITVFYNTDRVKQTDGSKVERHSILALRFDEVNGNKLTNPNRPIIPCSKASGGDVKAF